MRFPGLIAMRCCCFASLQGRGGGCSWGDNIHANADSVCSVVLFASLQGWVCTVSSFLLPSRAKGKIVRGDNVHGNAGKCSFAPKHGWRGEGAADNVHANANHVYSVVLSASLQTGG